MTSSTLPIPEALLVDEFSPTVYASSLVLQTNNASDTTLDLSTPLSKVLFDLQDVDSQIDSLARKHAEELMTFTASRQSSAERILAGLEGQLVGLNQAYGRLEEQVIARHTEANDIRTTAENLWKTVRLLRSVGRVVQLSRQVEIHSSSIEKEPRIALSLAASTIVSIRLFLASPEGEGLEMVNVVRELRDNYIEPVERHIRARSTQLIREFSLSSTQSSSSNSSPIQTQQQQTFAQIEDLKAKTSAAATALSLLSKDKSGERYLAGAVGGHIQGAINSSSTRLLRALSNESSVDSAFANIASLCRNLVALSALLSSTPTPSASTDLSTAAPIIQQTSSSLLPDILDTLDTPSLVSYFWRSLASNLSKKIADLAHQRPAVARYMRNSRNTLREGVSNMILRGSRLSDSGSTGAAAFIKEGAQSKQQQRWDREIAVMTGAIVGS
jgi:hypothetical protein